MLMEILAWLAALVVFACFFMKTIVSLRTLGMVSNVLFIGYALLGIHYGVFDKVLPILVLHLALLPLNFYRLREITKTIRNVRAMEDMGEVNDFLIPFMELKKYPNGAVLFNKGDDAKEVYLISRGQIAVDGIDKWLEPGKLFGFVVLFSSAAKRTATAVCQGDCEIYSITGFKMLELFYSDQRFALKIARSISNYAVDKNSNPTVEKSGTTIS